MVIEVICNIFEKKIRVGDEEFLVNGKGSTPSVNLLFISM